jgi:hypothetical protein
VYLLARRLFIQRGPALPSLDSSVTPGTTVRSNGAGGANCAAPPCTERVTDLNTTSATLLCPDQDPTGNKCTGGGSKQRAFEDALFQYLTDTGGAGSQQGAPGRCNLDPVLKQFGFLTCTDDCTTPPSGSSNLCSKTPFPTIPSTPAACVPTSGQWTYGPVTATVSVTTGSPSAPTCCSTNAAGTLSTNGVCSNSAATTCTHSTDCPAGTGVTCNFTASCAAATGRPVNSACSKSGVQAECASGLCTDLGGGLLACQ